MKRAKKSFANSWRNNEKQKLDAALCIILFQLSVCSIFPQNEEMIHLFLARMKCLLRTFLK